MSAPPVLDFEPVRQEDGTVTYVENPIDPSNYTGMPTRLSRAVSAGMVVTLAVLAFGLILSAVVTAVP